LLPTGGVNLDNIRDWIKAGSFAVGVGGALTSGANTGDYNEVTKVAEKFVEKINFYRNDK